MKNGKKISDENKKLINYHNDKAQKGKKTIDNIVNELSTIETSKYARNWERNQMLIDFNKIPDDVERSILDEWNTPMVVADRSKILSYMITKRLKNLIENIEEF